MEEFNEWTEVASVYRYTPSLVFSHGKDNKMNTICGISKNNQQHRSHFIPELCGKIICGSYLEWLVLKDKEVYEICVLNIETKEKVRLPNLASSEFNSVFLSSEPNDPQCHIICINLFKGKDVIMLCKPGDTEYVIKWQQTGDGQSIRAVTFFDGKFYLLLVHGYELIVLDVSDPTSSTYLQFKHAIGEGLPRPSRPDFIRTCEYLVDADNELLFVHKRYLYVSDEVYHFTVFRADFSSMAWVEIDCIGDRTIFLSASQGICSPAEIGGSRPNCIYFTQFGDRRLYVFDLKDRSFSSSLPCEMISKKEVDSIWIRSKNLHSLSKSIPRQEEFCTNKRVELVQGSCYKDQKEDEGTQRPSWTDLLPELLTSVLSRLFMSDHVAFRTVCKSWHSTYIFSPRLLQTPDPPTFKHPYLMFLNTTTKLFNFYHPIYDATYQLDAPEIYNAEIRFSRDNWLIMSVGEKDVFLFNPFTKTRLDLPDIPLECEFSRMYFFSSPNSPDFEVFGFSNGYHWMEISTIKLGEKEWTHDEYDNCAPKFRYADCSPVMCNGSVYFLGVKGNLGIYDLTSDDDQSWTVRVKPHERFKKLERCYLVESEGEIFSVLVKHGGEKVDVLKLDSETMSWNDVESLGDKMLFVSLNSSYSGRATVRGAGNKVYFPRLHGNGGIFYSLKTRKFHNTTSNFFKNESCQEREIKQSVWVQLYS